VPQHIQQPGPADGDHVSRILAELRDRADAELADDVRRLESMIEAVMRPTRTNPEAQLAGLVTSLRAIVAREEIEAGRALAAAARWNRTANIAGAAIAVVLIGGLATVTIWLWRHAFGPLIGVTHAIDRFARGERTASAPEEGPEELRKIAVAFNNMARSLGRQHEQQLAFVGGVAHDLRTPLNALRVGVALLEYQPADARTTARIVNQVVRMERMINDLLDSTRIEAGRLDLHLEPRDLREIVSRTLDVQRSAAPERAFVVSLPARPVVVRCDIVRIEQVLNNLLSNAVKYSPESSQVEVEIACDESTAVVSVRDQGVGIQPADRDRIFEPFSRGTNVGSIGGVGLGLSVTRKIVEGHGGTIEVRSTPGAGTVFTVRLPVVAAPTRADEFLSGSGRVVEC
jgi:signal transduction histidine kinase